MAKKIKKTTKKYAADDPALVNSSYTVFFVIATVMWAKIFSGYFPPVLHAHAFVLSILFALMLYIFGFLLLQFVNTTPILNMILLYFSLSAIMAFVSAVKGPLADGTIPAIQLSILGAHLYSAATPVYLLGTVFTFYGAVTYACSSISAALLEFFYNTLSKLLPKPLRRTLAAADRQIDSMSVAEAGRLFYDNEWKGVVATVTVLLLYTCAYLVSVMS